MKPVRISFTMSVLVEGFEPLADETVEEMLTELRKELRTGWKQTAYDLPWEIVDDHVEEEEPNVDAGGRGEGT